MFRRCVDNSLTLRSLTRDDAQPLLAVIDANRAHLRPWLDWVDATTDLRHLRAFCDKAVKREHAGKAIVAAICERGVIVGLIELRGIDRKRGDAELGFWLAADAQGRGVMTRAVRAMTDHGFNELGLQRIFAGCAEGNQRSTRLLERAGFERLGVQENAAVLHHQTIDMTAYQMTKDSRR